MHFRPRERRSGSQRSRAPQPPHTRTRVPCPRHSSRPVFDRIVRPEHGRKREQGTATEDHGRRNPPGSVVPRAAPPPRRREVSRASAPLKVHDIQQRAHASRALAARCGGSCRPTGTRVDYAAAAALGCVGYGSVFLAVECTSAIPLSRRPCCSPGRWTGILPQCVQKMSILLYLRSLCPVTAPNDNEHPALNPVAPHGRSRLSSRSDSRVAAPVTALTACDRRSRHCSHGHVLRHRNVMLRRSGFRFWHRAGSRTPIISSGVSYLQQPPVALQMVNCNSRGAPRPSKPRPPPSSININDTGASFEQHSSMVAVSTSS